MKKGKIILLNGVSSAGKTTLAKEIQRQSETPFYHICCDSFMDMTPEHILRRGFDKQLAITQGIMHETVRLFSDRGHCVVVDDVVLNLPEKNDWLYEYAVLLAQSPVLFVQVDCPLPELIRRQTARGDRHPDQAQWQMAHRYTAIPYDLTVDTFAESTERCAERILVALRQPNAGTALQSIRRQIEAARDIRG